MKGAAAGVSGLAAVVLLLPMEAGIPIPLPADLVMFTVGERVGAGQFPLWLAVAAFEIIAVAGTAALFAACRGPAHRLIDRYGPRACPRRADQRRRGAGHRPAGRRHSAGCRPGGGDCGGQGGREAGA